MTSATRRLVLIGLPVLAVVAACSTLSGIEPPRVSVVDLQMAPTGGLEQRVNAVLRIINPNDDALTIDGMVLALRIGGQVISEAVSAERVEMGRLTEARLPLGFSVAPLSIALGVLSGIGQAGTASGINWAIEGHAFVIAKGSRDRVPISETGTLSTGSISAR